MKKKVFYVMAASLVLASCADENIGFENQAVKDGSMVAVEDLNLEFTRGGEEGSRALWNEVEGGLSFAWENVAGVNTDKIGLVYVGQGGKLGITNYEFALDSLKLADYKVSDSPGFLPITGIKRTTGFYKVGSTADAGYTKKDGTALTSTDFVSSASAKFMTNYDAIMKGYYVTYSPYNTDYKNSGTAIPVTGEEKLVVNASQTNLQALGKATFAYSKPQSVEAGKQATYFDLMPLTNAFCINITNDVAGNIGTDIKSVVLRTKGDDKFVLSGTLVDPSADPSYNNMVAGTKTSTLFVNYAVASTFELPAVIAESDNAAQIAAKTLKVYFPVLPTSFAEQSFEVILIRRSDNKACVLNVTLPGTKTQAGKLYNFDVKVTSATPFNQAFITDEATFKTVLKGAVESATETTINLLGSNFVVDGLAAATPVLGSKVIINGTDLTLKNADIVLANTNNPDETEGTLTINAPVTFENSIIHGKVIVDDATIKGDVSVGHYNSISDLYYGQLIINGDATIEKDAKLAVPYSFKQGVTVSEGATLTVKKDGEYENGNFFYSNTNRQYYKSDLFINGTMTVEAGATFTDKGDTQVGATGNLVINGTATNYNSLNVKGGTLEIAGILTNEVADAGYDSSNKTGNGNVMVSTGNLTLKAEGKIYNKYSLNCMGTFENNGVFYDYVGSVYGGNPFTSNGKYACYVDAQTRLLEAVAQLNDYAAGKYQEIILMAGDYNLNVIDAEDAAALNIVNDGIVTINEDALYDTPVVINSLNAANGNLTINANINVAGATVATAAISPITIAEDATMTFENSIVVKANGAVVNEGTFNLKNAGPGMIPAKVYCKSIDQSVGTWTNYPIVQSNGNFWE